jgi:hypothetical protein
MRILRVTKWMSWAAVVGLVVVLAGCGGGESTSGEAEHSPATAAAPGLEPQHGGRIVELSGDFDAELVVMEGGMAFVYLYDADGSPVPCEGKTVWIRITTPDGKSQELGLEGMGTGAGAHFMNPLDGDMVNHVLEEGAYSAEVSVETETDTQSGSIDIEL